MQSERQLHFIFLTQKSTGNAFCQMLFQNNSLERKVLKSVLLFSEHINEIQISIAKEKNRNLHTFIYANTYTYIDMCMCVLYRYKTFKACFLLY